VPSIGPLEIVVIALAALIFIGPSKLPGVARNVGKALAEFKSHADGVKDEFRSGHSLDATASASTAAEITSAANTATNPTNMSETKPTGTDAA
jgi:Tat protein translocase TatB subunit